jgi:hypothetical protein
MEKIELFNQLKIDIAKGEAHDPVHMVDHIKEKQRKRTNPSKSTRISLNCRTPEQWTEFQMAKEKYFDVISDPHVALDLMIRALKAPDDETLKAWLASGHQQSGDITPGPAPPRAEIPNLPSWLKEKP